MFFIPTSLRPQSTNRIGEAHNIGTGHSQPVVYHANLTLPQMRETGDYMQAAGSHFVQNKTSILWRWLLKLKTFLGCNTLLFHIDKFLKLPVNINISILISSALFLKNNNWNDSNKVCLFFLCLIIIHSWPSVWTYSSFIWDLVWKCLYLYSLSILEYLIQFTIFLVHRYVGR